MPFSKNSCRLFGIAVIPAGWAAAKLAEPLFGVVAVVLLSGCAVGPDFLTHHRRTSAAIRQSLCRLTPAPPMMSRVRRNALPLGGIFPGTGGICLVPRRFEVWSKERCTTIPTLQRPNRHCALRARTRLPDKVRSFPTSMAALGLVDS